MYTIIQHSLIDWMKYTYTILIYTTHDDVYNNTSLTDRLDEISL